MLHWLCLNYVLHKTLLPETVWRRCSKDRDVGRKEIWSELVVVCDGVEKGTASWLGEMAEPQMEAIT